jgi:hypothetical protein
LNRLGLDRKPSLWRESRIKKEGLKSCTKTHKILCEAGTMRPTEMRLNC